MIGDQLRSTMNSFTALTDSLSDSQRMLNQLAGAVERMQRGLSGGVDGLKQIGAGATDMHASLTSVREDANRISAYLDAVRALIEVTPNCETNLICGQVQRAMDPIDGLLRGVNQTTDATAKFGDGTTAASAGLTDAAGALAGMRSTIDQLRGLIYNLTGTVNAIGPQLAPLTDYLNELRTDFQDSAEGGFYMPKRTLDEPQYRTVMPLLFSGDGHATRLLVYSDGQAWSGDGAHRAAQITLAVHDATKEGTLRGATVLTNGVGSATDDMQTFLAHDFTFLAAVALALVFMIVAVMLASPIAGLVVVATVVVSYGSALGVSALIWQHLLGHDLHWTVPAMSFIALVSVGADYNLLMATRLKQERQAGTATALI